MYELEDSIMTRSSESTKKITVTREHKARTGTSGSVNEWTTTALVSVTAKFSCDESERTVSCLSKTYSFDGYNGMTLTKNSFPTTYSDGFLWVAPSCTVSLNYTLNAIIPSDYTLSITCDIYMEIHLIMLNDGYAHSTYKDKRHMCEYCTGIIPGKS